MSKENGFDFDAMPAGAFFRFRARGGSMAPDYPDGQLIEVRKLDRSNVMTPGEDYFVWVGENAMFKRYAGMRDGMLCFRSIDSGGKPSEWMLFAEDIDGVAVVVATFFTRRGSEDEKSGTPQEPIVATPASKSDGKARHATAA